MKKHQRLAYTWAVAIGVGCASLLAAPCAEADELAYLVNVIVRPGYHFASADDALEYGRGVCDKVRQGRPYDAIIADLATDFATSDGYQASYLVSQAVNELCPASIWDLRNSAAHHRPATPQ